jgi:Na+(H+)/acetate symporter ActP
MSASLAMFLAFIAVTLGITFWAARRSAGASAYFAAGRQIKSWQNGVAVAGDYMSAASFLGIAGIIAFQGYDGFMYSVGWLVAYLTVLLVIAEPLRNAGKYTMADVLAYRLRPGPVRAMAALSTLTISHSQHPARLRGRHPRHARHQRAVVRAQIQRAARALEYRTGRGEGHRTPLISGLRYKR